MTKNYHCGELLSPALQAMLEKKLAKLEKYELGDAVIDVYMSKEGKDFAMKLAFQTDRHNLIAKSVNADMYKNIDECLAKLVAQLTK